MILEDIQIVAGIVSTLMFVSSNLPMLWKAFTTKDLTSYSLGHISLSNVGNLIYWLYLFTLPVGPVWFLHGFNTVVAGMMLVGYLRYRGHNNAPNLGGERGGISLGSIVSCVCPVIAAKEARVLEAFFGKPVRGVHDRG